MLFYNSYKNYIDIKISLPKYLLKKDPKYYNNLLTNCFKNAIIKSIRKEKKNKRK